MSSTEQRLRSLQALLERDPQAGDAAGALPRLRAMLETMERDGNRRHDPIREIFARLGDKWSPLLLLLLNTRDYRHTTLWRLVDTLAGDGKISQRILRLRLRALERDGLVTHHAVPGKIPGVRYAITDTGRELVAHIEQLMQWVRSRSAEIRADQPRNRRMPSS
jgi:DNA-binding HxlR family transcriptional regulator